MRRASAMIAALVLAMATCIPALAANPDHPSKPNPKETASPVLAPSPTPTAKVRGHRTPPPAESPAASGDAASERSEPGRRGDETPSTETASSPPKAGTFTLILRAFTDPDGAGPADAVPLPGAEFSVGSWDPDSDWQWIDDRVETKADGSVSLRVPLAPTDPEVSVAAHGIDGLEPSTTCVDVPTGYQVGSSEDGWTYLSPRSDSVIRCDTVHRPSPVVLIIESRISRDGHAGSGYWDESEWRYTITSSEAAPASAVPVPAPEADLPSVEIWPLDGVAATLTVSEQPRRSYSFAEAVCYVPGTSIDEDGEPIRETVTFRTMPFELEVQAGGWYYCVVVHRPLDPNWRPGDEWEEEPGNDTTGAPHMTPPETATTPPRDGAILGASYTVVVMLLAAVTGLAAVGVRPRMRRR